MIAGHIKYYVSIRAKKYDDSWGYNVQQDLDELLKYIETPLQAENIEDGLKKPFSSVTIKDMYDSKWIIYLIYLPDIAELYPSE